MTIANDLLPELSLSADNPNGAWTIGNARLINLSGKLLGAHIAHAGLIAFWAGSVTVGEALRYNPEVPLGMQRMTLLPHLFMLGWDDSYACFVIGMLHLIGSAVLGAGGLFHVIKGPAVLKDGGGIARWFHYEWNDGKQLTMILGHHLLMLGLAALAFVLKAMFGGGIYDAQLDAFREVNPTLNPLIIFGYLFGQVHGQWNPLGIAAVDNLEDIVGGHLWLAVMLIGGGIWHLLSEPFDWVKARVPFEAEAILSYSLAGLALMAFISAVFVGSNELVFPAEFFGSDQDKLAVIQFFLGVVVLGGHIWHATRSRIKLGLWRFQ